MAVYRLDNKLWFPDPRTGEADGLVAIGGDLSVPRLLLAYSNGFFPWYAFHHFNEPLWYCPMQRYVIFPFNTSKVENRCLLFYFAYVVLRGLPCLGHLKHST